MLGRSLIRDDTDRLDLASEPELFNTHDTRKVTKDRVGDLRPLEGLTELRSLHLGGNEIRELHPLSRLNSLEELSLWGNQIHDVRSLARLIQLRHLELRRYEQLYGSGRGDNPIRNPEVLFELPNLECCLR